MLKWIEISRDAGGPSIPILSDFLTSRNVENQLVAEPVERTEFDDRLKWAMANFDAVRIGSPFREIVLNHFTNYGEDMLRLKAADSLCRLQGKWWPKASIPWGFEEMLRRQGAELDLDGSALIVGAGAGARFASSVLIKMGVKRVNITNKFSEQAYTLIEDLRRTYFDVAFEYITPERLVLLPGTNVILVNTTPLSPSNDLLRELYYFNFLRSTGMVVDLTIFPYQTPLIQGALAIGIQVLRGYQIAAAADMHWVEKAFGLEFSIDEYSVYLEERIKAMPFDLTPYLEPTE